MPSSFCPCIGNVCSTAAPEGVPNEGFSIILSISEAVRAVVGTEKWPLTCGNDAPPVGIEPTTPGLGTPPGGSEWCLEMRISLWHNGFGACCLLTLLVVSRAETGRRRDATTGRPERSGPLTVGRPPASWTAGHPPLVGGLSSGGQGGPGRSAVKGGPGIWVVAGEAVVREQFCEEGYRK